MQRILENVTEGNPGCMSFLRSLVSLPDMKGLDALTVLLELEIRGTRAYKLWNDCCGRDTEKTAKILSLVKDRKIAKEELYAHIDRPYGIPFNIEEICSREAQPIKEYRMRRVDMDPADQGIPGIEKLRKDRAYSEIMEAMFRNSDEIGKTFVVEVEECYEKGILYLKATKEEVRKWI